MKKHTLLLIHIVFFFIRLSAQNNADTIKHISISVSAGIGIPLGHFASSGIQETNQWELTDGIGYSLKGIATNITVSIPIFNANCGIAVSLTQNTNGFDIVGYYNNEIVSNINKYGVTRNIHLNNDSVKTSNYNEYGLLAGGFIEPIHSKLIDAEGVLMLGYFEDVSPEVVFHNKRDFNIPSSNTGSIGFVGDINVKIFPIKRIYISLNVYVLNTDATYPSSGYDQFISSIWLFNFTGGIGYRF